MSAVLHRIVSTPRSIWYRRSLRYRNSPADASLPRSCFWSGFFPVLVCFSLSIVLLAPFSPSAQDDLPAEEQGDLPREQLDEDFPAGQNQEEDFKLEEPEKKEVKNEPALEALEDTFEIGIESDAPEFLDTISEIGVLKHMFLKVLRMPKIDEKIGIAEVGTNLFLSQELFADHWAVGLAGFELGFWFPMRIPNMNGYYKATAIFHGAMWDNKINVAYMAASNEFLFGKGLRFTTSPIEYMPLMGAGICNGLTTKPHKGIRLVADVVHYYLFWSTGIMIRYPFQFKRVRVNAGGYVCYQHAFQPEEPTETRMMYAVIFCL